MRFSKTTDVLTIPFDFDLSNTIRSNYQQLDIYTLVLFELALSPKPDQNPNSLPSAQ